MWTPERAWDGGAGQKKFKREGTHVDTCQHNDTHVCLLLRKCNILLHKTIRKI